MSSLYSSLDELVSLDPDLYKSISYIKVRLSARLQYLLLCIFFFAYSGNSGLSHQLRGSINPVSSVKKHMARITE